MQAEHRQRYGKADDEQTGGDDVEVEGTTTGHGNATPGEQRTGTWRGPPGCRGANAAGIGARWLLYALSAAMDCYFGRSEVFRPGNSHGTATDAAHADELIQ